MTNIEEKVNSFLQGSNPMERVVNIECGYDDDQAAVIFTKEDGSKRYRRMDFKPFVWAKNSACVRMFDGNRSEIVKALNSYGIRVEKLSGKDAETSTDERVEDGFNYIFYATKKMSWSKFQSFFSKAGTPIYPKKKKDDQSFNSNKEFLSVSVVEQFMIEYGIRLFKGYNEYDDTKRLIWDIETTGLNPEKDTIDQIGVRTNKGMERIIYVDGDTLEEKLESEHNAIEEFIKTIRDEKADEIIGHNSENFDWNFIIVRWNKYGDESFEEMTRRYFAHEIYKKKKESILKLGGEVEYFHQTIMWGTTILDSMHAVRRAQAIDSDIKSANLKYVTKYLDLNKTNRVYVPGGKIGTIFRDETNKYAFNEANGDWYKITSSSELKEDYKETKGRYIVERYLLDDLWETDKVELTLNEANFLISKILPTTFQRACTMGTAGIWKLIMVAWCYENHLPIPSFGQSKSFTGGLSRLLKVGYVDRIVKLDYNSLYPSIMLTWWVKNGLDATNIMLNMLNYVLTNREKYKGLKNSAGEKAKSIKAFINKNKDTLSKEELEKYNEELKEANAEKNANDKKQSPLKVLGNSVFGSFGAPSIFPFGNTQAAEMVTCIGRQCLRLMIHHFSSLGYEPIVGDSVTYDTPIIIKYDDDKIDILPICDLFDDNNAIDFENEQYRDFSIKNYQVLTRNGWQKIGYVYKHKTSKQLKRVETKNGVIDCTEDHSLFDDKGNEVKPSELKRGDKLEIYTDNIDCCSESSITEYQAWLYGFFMADGSSTYCDRKQKYFSKRKGEFVIHKGKRAFWKISNKSLNRLNKAKDILENDFNVKAIIKDHLSSSNVYNLIVHNTDFAKFFSTSFYTTYRYKKVPSFILNAPKEIKKSFIDGVCCGDGQNDTIDECIEFGQKSKVAMGGLYFILKELGYNFRCHNRKDKNEFISFRFRNHRGNLLNEKYSDRKEDEVWSCSNIVSKSEYVYDISADGTFVNALGMIVCHNTDGFNFQMPTEDKFRYTKEHPYISNGGGRNSVKGKEYVGIDADVCEFEDLYFSHPWNGGINKMGLGIDEFCDSTINFSRKNYADKLANGKTKKVGNTIKSRRMAGYIDNFLNPGIDLLLNGKGAEFLNMYYDYISKIYNYQIPVKDIASKGKIKKTLKEYLADCETLTKAGNKKSRQAWYELALKNNLKVDLNDTIYYVNTAASNSQSADVKKIVHQYIIVEGKEVELKGKVKTSILKEWATMHNVDYKSIKAAQAKEILKPYIKREEEEIILNCTLIPTEIAESDDNLLCSDISDTFEYNVDKYINTFNKRISVLLVCFRPEIRNRILITKPSDKPTFTEKECELCCGCPNKETDQDTYKALMTPERKEIEYWLSINDTPPFVKECEIDWDGLVAEYKKMKEKEEDILFKEENAKYLEALSKLTKQDIDDFEDDEKIPKSIDEIVELHNDLHFYFRKLNTMRPSTGGYIFDDLAYVDKSEEEYENAFASMEQSK